MSSYTCISCHVVFANADLQREHYKSDWHRYNLKRKIAELPPITIDVFEQRVQAQANKPSADVQNSSYCSQCRKSFRNQNAYENHVKSKKHQELELSMQKNKHGTKVVSCSSTPIKNEKSQDTSETKGTSSFMQSIDDDDNDSDWESCSDEEDAGVPLEPTECLFCSYSSSSIEANVEHMTTQHSFFIPDVEYLVDLEGLLVYLGEKVGEGHICLWCCEKGKSFLSTKAVQQHMIDKGHCKLLHEGEALLEYSDFYDYSSSYPEGEDGENGDSEVTIPELDGTGWQLVLPSGAMIGHRSLARYYKQSVPPERPKTDRRQKALRDVLSRYRALGWKETAGSVAVQKARDIKFMTRIRDKQYVKLGIKQSKFQPHFRPQVAF